MSPRTHLITALSLSLCFALPIAADVVPLRVGVLGIDTSHAPAFTRLFNSDDTAFAGVKVVAGFPGGTDVPSSRNRVERFTKELVSLGVVICDTIPEMLEKVDVVLLESVDGRPHLKQALPVFKAGKPVFIDKPLAGSLADAVAIVELGKKYSVPWFSSSSLRFSPGILGMRGASDATGRVTGCSSWGPCPTEPSHPDLFWYGVHGVEILFTVMGPGCERVTRVRSDGAELVTGVWNDGRIGTFRGIRRGKSGYGAMVFGEKGIARAGEYEGYKPLCEKIVAFFATRKAPVEIDETIELFAFMEAADESKRRGGSPVSIAEVMTEARSAARLRLRELGEE